MHIPFLTKKDEAGEIYCGILLKEKEGSCILFRKTAQTLAVFKEQPFTYTDGWEHIVDDVDEALALLEQGGDAIHATQCIFFIFSHLIDPVTKEIAKPYLSKMRDIAKFLDLKPVGYIEVIDAVHEYLEQLKETRLSSLVIETDVSQATIFLYKGGHKIGSQLIERTASFGHDVEVALTQFTQTHILPTHIYMYDSSELHKESTELLIHNWKQELFMQQPRITVIQESEVRKALTNLLVKQLYGDTTTPQVTPSEHELPKKETLGFVVGVDIAKEQDIVAAPAKPPSMHLPKVPHITLPSVKYLPLLGGVVGLALLIGGFFYFIHRATITVHIPTETKQDTIVITASTKPTSSDQAELTTSSSPFSLNSKKDTTGKKDIGNAATGQVTLYGYEDSDRQLAQGTDLVTNSLHFTTDSQVTIPASQFASDGITKNPGKVSVTVHAAAIGTDGNIDKNQRFSVAGLSSNSVFGINESAFAGGTSKTVRTVAKGDMDTLKTTVLDMAKKNALDLQKKDTSYIVIADLTSAKVNKETYSAEVGEEATSLTYTASGDVTLYRIPQSAVQSLVTTKLEAAKKQGYKTDSVTFTVLKQVKDNKGNVQLTVQGEAQTSKEVDTHAMAATAQGKLVQEAHDALISAYGLDTVTISVFPPLPLIQDHMPFWSSHIQVDVVK